MCLFCVGCGRCSGDTKSIVPTGICPLCGAPNEPDAVECCECGVPLSPAKAGQPNK